MNGTNLFEQNALAERAARPRVPVETPLEYVKRFISTASDSDRVEILESLMACELRHHGVEFGLQDAIEQIREANEEQDAQDEQDELTSHHGAAGRSA